jgi:hypothetical protein
VVGALRTPGSLSGVMPATTYLVLLPCFSRSLEDNRRELESVLVDRCPVGWGGFSVLCFSNAVAAFSRNQPRSAIEWVTTRCGTFANVSLGSIEVGFADRFHLQE